MKVINMNRLLLSIFALLFVASTSAVATPKPLFSPEATGEDLLNTCKAALIELTEADVASQKDQFQRDATWNLIVKKTECFNYVTGMIHGNANHTLLMNDMLNRDINDTGLQRICVADRTLLDVTAAMVKYMYTNVALTDLRRHDASASAYITLSILYPCTSKNSM